MCAKDRCVREILVEDSAGVGEMRAGREGGKESKWPGGRMELRRKGRAGGKEGG